MAAMITGVYMPLKWISLFFSFVLCMSLPGLSLASGGDSDGGGMDSGGGSVMASAFAEQGHQAARVIATLKNFPLTAEQFTEIVRSTRVEVTRETLLDPDGIEVDALNFPKRKLIKINYEKWFDLIFAPQFKLQLVVHEYLGVGGINDSGYAVSRLMNQAEGVTRTTVCQMKDESTGEVDYAFTHVESGSVGDGDYLKSQFTAYDFISETAMQSSAPFYAVEDENGHLLLGAKIGFAFKAYMPFKFIRQENSQFTVDYYFVNLQNKPEEKPAGVLYCKVSTQ